MWEGLTILEADENLVYGSRGRNLTSVLWLQVCHIATRKIASMQMLLSLLPSLFKPHTCSGVVRIYPIRFLDGCYTRRLNQALSFLSLSLYFLSVYVVLLTRAPFCIVLFCVTICVFCLLLVLVRLSVPVQVIDWKDSTSKWPIICWWEL